MSDTKSDTGLQARGKSHRSQQVFSIKKVSILGFVTQESISSLLCRYHVIRKKMNFSKFFADKVQNVTMRIVIERTVLCNTGVLSRMEFFWGE